MPSPLTLAVPDVSTIDTVWRNPHPFPLWPVGDRPLLGHWLEEASRRGAAGLRLFAPDRPERVRAYLAREDHALAPVTEVIATPAPDNGVEWMTRLPGTTGSAIPWGETLDVLRHWFGLQETWLETHSAGAVPVVAPGACIHRSARLVGPVWIGRGAEIGPDCVVGPHTVVEHGSALGEGVRAERSFVAAGSLVPSGRRLERHLVQGGLCVDLAAGRRENLFLGGHGHARRPGAPPLLSRAAALVLYYALAPAWIAQQRFHREEELHYCSPATGSIERTRTADSGPLLLRRRLWLKEIVKGRMAWLGPLPREADALRRCDPRWRATLESALPGVLSLSDLHDCADAAHPDEWTHAVCQLSLPRPAIRRLVRRHWRRFV